MKEKSEVAVTNKLKNLIHRCILFTDKHGHVVSKESTPVSCRLRMEYKSNGLQTYMHVTTSAMGSGGYQIKVKRNGRKVVLSANGSFATVYNYPDSPNIVVYMPGAWEKKIPPINKLER